jgi:hypothetical protein
MNLASCVADWFSTRTAGELLAGTKRLHPTAPRQNRRPPNTERVLEWPPTPTRTAVRPCGLRNAHPTKRESTAASRAGPGNPIPIPHRSTPGRAAPVIARRLARRWTQQNAGSRSGKISRKPPRS